MSGSLRSLAERTSMVGGLAYVAQGVVTALSPSRLVVAFLGVLLLVLLGKGYDASYLALGGRPYPPPGVAASAANRPLDVERTARQIAAKFTERTSASASVGPELSLTDLRRLVDIAGSEKLAAATDQERARVLAAWDQTVDWLLRAQPRGPAAALNEGLGSATRRLVAGVSGWSIAEASAAVADGVVRVPVEVTSWAPVGAILWLALVLLTLALTCGSLARMSALEGARSEKISSREALRWTKGAVLRLLGVPLAPLALSGLLMGVVILLGVLFRVPGLDLIAAILYGALLLAVTLIVITALAGALGMPFAVASVACGDSDALDATVRVTAYFFRAPLRSLGLVIAGVLAIGVGVGLVGMVNSVVLAISAWAVGLLGLSSGATEAAAAAGAPSLLADAGRAFGEVSTRLPGFTARPAAALIDLWEAGFALLTIAFIVSAIAECATRAYLLLRLACDGEDFSALDGVPLGRAQ